MLSTKEKIQKIIAIDRPTGNNVARPIKKYELSFFIYIEPPFFKSIIIIPKFY